MEKKLLLLAFISMCLTATIIPTTAASTPTPTKPTTTKPTNVALTAQSSLPYNAKPIGCYLDNPTRDLNYMAYQSSTNTIELCIETCYSLFYKYIGLQDTDQCFCGNTYGIYGLAAATDCNYTCAGNSKETCGGYWRNYVYQFDQRPNPCATKNCGIGAICSVSVENDAICTCPSGQVSVNGNCCGTLHCGCYGDPHCHQFDGNLYEFQGRCKYDWVTTNCSNGKTLPSSLTPFSVNNKQHYIAGVPNAGNVSFFKYVQVNAYGVEIRLLQEVDNIFYYSYNNITFTPPYHSLEFNITTSCNQIILTTDFGLTVYWDGSETADLTLCSAYAGYVCGLCGNADGNPNNDFVDRNNKNVVLSGSEYVQYYNWGCNWRVWDDQPDDADINSSPCNPFNSPGTISGPGCSNPDVYNGTSWCGILQDKSGPWADCLAENPNFVNGAIIGCKFELCMFENNKTAQNIYKCNVYYAFNNLCLKMGLTLNKNWTFNWRTSLNCPLTCGANQEYTIQRSCQRSCEYPDGIYNCGDNMPVEGCFCSANYVWDGSNCIDAKDCQPVTTKKATTVATTKPTTVATTKPTTVATTKPTTIATTTKPTTKSPTTTPKGTPCNPNKCGENQICTIGSQGQAVCSCAPGKVPVGSNCCSTLHCGCYGDPHCHQFDGHLYEFQGRCKYDWVTTNCSNGKTLPSTLTPFSVNNKQHYIAGVFNAANVSFFKYVQVNAYGVEIRLLQKVGNQFYYSYNNVTFTPPLHTPQFNITTSCSQIILTTDFGLTVFFDGSEKADLTLCDDYSGYVCGLCGNADGNPNNDFFDRNNKNVVLSGSEYVQYYNWGCNWRVWDDQPDDADINSSPCNPSNPPGTITGPNCANISIYNQTNFCGALFDINGVWALCLEKNPSFVNDAILGCTFEMCMFESNSSLQKDYLCNVYYAFNDFCLQFGLGFDLNWSFDWRTELNCAPQCGANQVYETRSSCQNTCEHPDGVYCCGDQRPIEACYCADGYVLDGSNCVKQEECTPKTTPLLPTVATTPKSGGEATTTPKIGGEATTTPKIGGEATTTPKSGGTTKAPFYTFPTSPSKCRESQQKCLIIGDPIYIPYGQNLTSSKKFLISTDCTYLIASDSCELTGTSIYQIYGVHEKRDDSLLYYLSQVVVKYGTKTYKYSTKGFFVNDVATNLPFDSYIDDMSISKIENQITLTTIHFTFKYDGENYFSFSKCGNDLCGLCGIQENGQNITYDSDHDHYLLNDPSNKECQSSAKFPPVLDRTPNVLY